MNTISPRMRRKGFTLIELLVVIAIVAVLLGLLLPAIQIIRQKTDRAVCASRLRQIGNAMQMYRDANRGAYPNAARLPSFEPDRKGLHVILSEYVEKNAGVFRCPSDHEYFPKEGISYEYPRDQISLEEMTAKGRASSRIWVLFDYEPFHGLRGSGTGRNFLYADGHVSE